MSGYYYKVPAFFWFNHGLDSREEIHQIFALFFFEKFKTSKSHFEINWSLGQCAGKSEEIQMVFALVFTSILLVDIWQNNKYTGFFFVWNYGAHMIGLQSTVAI